VTAVAQPCDSEAEVQTRGVQRRESRRSKNAWTPAAIATHGHCGSTIRWPEIVRRIVMTQMFIEVVGTSKESFAKAAENAVAEAAKTVRGMKWARVAELEMELDGKKITKYRTTTKIYFEIEK
jgi:dodecin